jgi:hypothetical protein
MKLYLKYWYISLSLPSVQSLATKIISSYFHIIIRTRSSNLIPIIAPHRWFYKQVYGSVNICNYSEGSKRRKHIKCLINLKKLTTLPDNISIWYWNKNCKTINISWYSQYDNGSSITEAMINFFEIIASSFIDIFPCHLMLYNVYRHYITRKSITFLGHQV